LRARIAAPGIDVDDARSACRGAIAAPELDAGLRIVRDEVDRRTDDPERRRITARRSRIEIADQLGAVARPIAAPQLGAVHAVVGGEVRYIAGGGHALIGRHHTPRLPGMDVLDQAPRLR